MWLLRNLRLPTLNQSDANLSTNQVYDQTNHKFLIRSVAFSRVWGGKPAFTLGSSVLTPLMFFPGSVGYRNCFSSVYDADSRKRLENAILVPYIVWKTFWYVYSQDLDANEKDNSKEFFIAVKYEADLEIKG